MASTNLSSDAVRSTISLEQDSNSSQTSIDNNQINWTTSSSSSSSNDAESNSASESYVYFQAFVVIIAVVGSFANGGVLYILRFGKLTKNKMMNVLLINQTAIDFYSCFTLTITYAVKLCNIYHTGTFGYWLCTILTGEMVAWFGLNSSMINLGFITLERYVKVVHSIWHKNHVRPWMAYAGCGWAWTSGIALNAFLYPWTTVVADGQCLAIVVWSKKSDNVIYGIWYYLYYFQLPLFLFIYCYARILLVIRHQNRIFSGQQHQNQQRQLDNNAASSLAVPAAAAAAGSSSRGQKSSRSQINATRTMIMVTAFFALSWFPNHMYYLILNVVDSNLNLLNDGWYATLFVAFFNICANPFIYIASYDDVKIYLAKKFGFVRFVDGSMSITITLSEQVR